MSNTDVRPNFLEKHSLAIRLWHWIFFLLISATLIVVLFASTTFRTGRNVSLVTQQLQQKNVTVDTDQARVVAHAFNDKLWDLHTWIGYFIAAFLVGRLVLEWFQPSDERLVPKLKRAMGFHPSPGEDGETRHYIRVKWGYIIFYVLITVMALTGLGLAFRQLPFFRSIRKPLTNLHVITQYLIYGYILLHLGGVILADIGRYPGLVSGMIHGRKRI